MDQAITAAEISEVEKLRRQTTYWRTGATVLVLLFAVISIYRLNQAAHNLADPGPGQEQFVQTMQAEMKTSVTPQIQAMARTTFTQMQPVIQHELAGLNRRVPEVADATMKELSTLEAELPERGSKVLEQQLDNALKVREQRIREMFPEMTDAQMVALMDNLRNSGHDEIISVNHDLFAQHQAKLQNILDGMRKIEQAEGPNLKNVDPDWEMGLSILAVLHDDLSSLRPDAASAKTAAGAKAKTNQTAPQGKKAPDAK